METSISIRCRKNIEQKKVTESTVVCSGRHPAYEFNSFTRPSKWRYLKIGITGRRNKFSPAQKHLIMASQYLCTSYNMHHPAVLRAVKFISSAWAKTTCQNRDNSSAVASVSSVSIEVTRWNASWESYLKYPALVAIPGWKNCSLLPARHCRRWIPPYFEGLSPK